MNKKLLTFALATIITLGGTTGIYAAASSKPSLAADAVESTMQTITAETSSEKAITEPASEETVPSVLPTLPPIAEPTTAPTTAPTTEPTTAPTTAPTAAPVVVKETKPQCEDKEIKEPIDPSTVLINEEEAKAIALNFAGTTGEFVKIELEDENGVVIYEIKIKTDTALIEVKVDANTGVILSSGIKDCIDKEHQGDQDKSWNCSGKNFEAFLDNAARKSGDASWDGETRKNDLAWSDNAARKGDKSNMNNSQVKSEDKTGNDCQNQA